MNETSMDDIATTDAPPPAVAAATTATAANVPIRKGNFRDRQS